MRKVICIGKRSSASRSAEILSVFGDFAFFFFFLGRLHWTILGQTLRLKESIARRAVVFDIFGGGVRREAVLERVVLVLL